jgi:hypothetical protein
LVPNVGSIGKLKLQPILLDTSHHVLPALEPQGLALPCLKVPIWARLAIHTSIGGISDSSQQLSKGDLAAFNIVNQGVRGYRVVAMQNR